MGGGTEGEIRRNSGELHCRWLVAKEGKEWWRLHCKWFISFNSIQHFYSVGNFQWCNVTECIYCTVQFWYFHFMVSLLLLHYISLHEIYMTALVTISFTDFFYIKKWSAYITWCKMSTLTFDTWLILDHLVVVQQAANTTLTYSTITLWSWYGECVGVCVYMMNESLVFTLILALILVSTKFREKCLALKLLNASLCNSVCLLQGR